MYIPLHIRAFFVSWGFFHVWLYILTTQWLGSWRYSTPILYNIIYGPNIGVFLLCVDHLSGILSVLRVDASVYIYKAISTRPVLSGLTVFTTSHQLSWSCLCIQQFKREFVCLHLSSKFPICLGNFISFLMTQSESFNSYTAITSPLLSWCFSPVFVKLAYSEKIQILGHLNR